MKVFSIGNGQYASLGLDPIMKTLDCMHDAQAILIQSCPSQIIRKEQEEKMETNANKTSTVERKYVLRRLTPLECLRLMGLPDWWVDGTDGSDSAIYKMCGNGLAIPCAYDVIHRIANELEKSE